jgi:hypothetical protein
VGSGSVIVIRYDAGMPARPEGAALSFLRRQKAQRGRIIAGVSASGVACDLRHGSGGIGGRIAEVLKRRERLGLRRAGRGLRRRGGRRVVSSIDKLPRAQIAAHRHGRGALSFNSLTTRCASFGPTPCAARTEPQSPSATARATPSAPKRAQDRHRRLCAHTLHRDQQPVPFPLIRAEKPEKLQQVLPHQKLGVERHGLSRWAEAPSRVLSEQKTT